MSAYKDSITRDPTYLREYGLTIFQPSEGYRFSVDSLILARFVRTRKRDKILELGAGCGVISLILAKINPYTSITAIEIQTQLTGLFKKNVSVNGLEEQITVIEGDINRIREIIPAGVFDHVVANPPFRSHKTGRLCRNVHEARARHELLTSLENVLDATRYALKPGGRVSLIYSADLLTKLVYFMREKRLEPKRMQFIHPSPDTKARMAVVEGVKDAGEELLVLPPEFLTNGNF